ncbi:MAG: MFS transporter, partial [Eggerthellaceae bacterium]|nr:MFS transporter [Eggerthellaceae bacterium]
SAGWQSIFLINVPVGVVGSILVLRFVPKLPTSRPRLDWTGVVLSGIGIFLVVFGLQEGADQGWGPIWGPITIVEIIVAGILMLIAFVFWQTRARNPLVPLALFRTRDFSLANAAIFLIGLCVASMSLPLLYFIQVARGLDPMLSAVFMMPSAVVGAIIAPFVGARFVAKFGANRVACFGLLTYAAGLIGYIVLLTPTSNIWLALIPSAITGLGSSCMWSPISMSATHELPQAQAGVGAGIYNTIRQIGSALGSALMTVLMTTLLITYGVDPSIIQQHVQGVALAPALAAPFSQAMAGSLWLPAGVAIAGAVLAAFLTSSAGRQAEPTPQAESHVE